MAGSPLANLEELDLENQRGVRRDDLAGSLLAIAEVRGHDEPALAADPHSRDPLVPPLDHLVDADAKGKGMLGILAGIKAGAVLQPADVVDFDGIARLRFLSLAELEIGVAQAGAGDDFFAAALLGW